MGQRGRRSLGPAGPGRVEVTAFGKVSSGNSTLANPHFAERQHVENLVSPKKGGSEVKAETRKGCCPDDWEADARGLSLF